MVSVDELNDDEEYNDLKEDVEEECKRFGTVLALEIPRPKVCYRLTCFMPSSFRTNSCVFERMERKLLAWAVSLFVFRTRRRPRQL